MSQAVFPRALRSKADRVGAHVALWALGTLLMCALARITIPLPWSPVPITGQTFGVALLALTLGARLALPVLLTYVGLGLAGAPVFALGASGLRLATAGYLVGMVLAAFVVGRLADRGWTRSFGRALAAAYVGSGLVFACGLAVLSRFVPAEALLSAGLFPFLIGDFVKNVTAASLASAGRKLV